MKYIFDLGIIHCIESAPGKKGEFRITKQPAGAEKFAFQPQAAFGRTGKNPVFRGQNGEDAIRLPYLDLAEHKAWRDQLHSILLLSD